MSGNTRCRERFNFGWRFCPGDPADAHEPGFDDADWRPIDLPHDWSIEGQADESIGPANGFRPRGVGWYRRRFQVLRSVDGRRVCVEFEGVYMASDVWVNGRHLSRRLNGYLDYEVEITGALRPAGEENVIAVRVDNSIPGTSRWYTGGGIYRHVWLVQTADLHVPRCGTYVTTPVIRPEAAIVRVQTRVRNDSEHERLVTLLTTITDPAGAAAVTGRAVFPVEPRSDYTASQEMEVPSPRLWAPDDPALYTAVTIVADESGEQDRYHTTFGVREFRFDPDQGLLVNGTKVFCKGFNIHHDTGCLGTAAFDRAIERRLEIMKELGCNAVRLSHNPHATSLLDLCDRMGILVISEAYDKWTDQFNGGMAPFSETWRSDVADWLARDRNHASVFLWSVGNEPTVHQLSAEHGYGVPQLTELVDYVHAQEPTRKVTAALYPARRHGIRYDDPAYRTAEPSEMMFAMDVVSVNYMESFFDRDHARYPQLVFVLSEATTHWSGNPLEADSGGGRALASFRFDHAYTVGLFYWGGIDYIGESEGWPSQGWVRGFVDTSGGYKPSAWLLKASFSDEPVVGLAITSLSREETVVWNDVELVSSEIARHWNWENGSTVEVTAFTNCESVEFLVNGHSLGERVVRDEDRLAVSQRLMWEPGAITAIARTGGVEVARDELTTAALACRIELRSDVQALNADGLDLAHVTVLVVDDKGTVVPDARHTITFEVAGQGTNAGVDNGDLGCGELWQSESRSVCRGRALVVVRSGQEPGTVTIRATAAGLSPAAISIPVSSVG